ncbi:MAG: hypothetical protein V4525_11810 [Pseudomonadota bacterium]
MKTYLLFTTTALSALLSLSAIAQPVSTINERQGNQERRIDQGIRSGELTPRETNRLEHGQEHVDRLENRAKADGRVTPQERERIEQVQNAQNRKIYEAKHNNTHDLNHNGIVDGSHPVAHPAPTIDQRQTHQERRIDQGIRSGELTPREANRLARGQEHIDRLENRAKADGVVTRWERQRIQQAQNEQNRRIYRAKHNYRHDLNHNGVVDR